ncbi:MAG: hypothetical protein J0L51_00025 [Rhizobiales bacterium]|nr:hypothetical protein [Hyphomicrobiales bacterium]
MSFWRSITRLFAPSGTQERLQASAIAQQAADRAAEQQAANQALLAQQQEFARQQAEQQRALVTKLTNDQQAEIARSQQAELDKTRLEQSRIAQEGEAAASAMQSRVKRAGASRGVASTLLRKTGLAAGPTAAATLLGA